MPPASETPGQAGAAPADSAAHEADPFVLPADRLPMGRQSVGLTVDVVGPKVLNINQEAELKIVVRNTGTTDAMGVVVRDQLPESLAFLTSQPEAQRTDALLFWRLNTVPAGSERFISVKVKPIKVGPFDHAATVTMLAGSKSRTIVREAKLKVEQVATTGKVLKGQPVQFRITISNPGDGPARNVIVQAKLSPGLRVDSGGTSSQNLFELPPFDIEPYQRVVLDTLEADTLQSGDQTCTVVAQSPDVSTSKDEAKSVATVVVVEPRMKLAISGDEKRFTDTIASYHVSVENPGSATAHNVRVLVTLPLSGRLVGSPSGGARWDPASGRLLWTIPQIDPGEKAKAELPFQVRMGNPGFYKVTVDARADGGLSDQTSFNTDVVGMADVEFEVHEQRRFVDVGDETAFQIRIKNVGTKEARRILVRAELSKNIEPFMTNNGTEDPTEAKLNPEWTPDKQLLVFPEIDHLAHDGKDIIMGIKVKAKGEGLGTCKVSLLHDELKETEALQDMAHLRITAPRR